jgi:ribonuclease D
MEHLINALRAVRDENSKKLAIDPGVLMPTNLMTIIARNRPRDPSALRAIEELYDWQADLLGEQIIAAVREVMNGHFPKVVTKTKSSSPANPPAA